MAKTRHSTKIIDENSSGKKIQTIALTRRLRNLSMEDKPTTKSKKKSKSKRKDAKEKPSTVRANPILSLTKNQKNRS